MEHYLGHKTWSFRSPTFSVSGPKLSHAKIAMDGVWMGWGWIANNLNDTLAVRKGFKARGRYVTILAC